VPQPTPGKRLRRFARYLALRSLLGAAGLLPLSWAVWLGELWGALAYRVLPGEREKALRSLAIAFPEASASEREALCRRSFLHLGRCALEIACIRRIDARMAEYVLFPEAAQQLLREALSAGKGVVFISGHVGNWELLARRVAHQGFPCQSIAKEASDPRTTAFIQRLRDEGKVGTLWRGHPGVARQMLRALRSGEILGLVIDQDTKVQSVFVPFFGVEAATPRAAADLALRTGAPVLAGFCQRRSDGRYELHLEAVASPLSGQTEQDVVSLTLGMSAAIERAIRRHPEQWVWMHQRWKTRPPLALNIDKKVPSDA